MSTSTVEVRKARSRGRVRCAECREVMSPGQRIVEITEAGKTRRQHEDCEYQYQPRRSACPTCWTELNEDGTCGYCVD